MKTIRRRIRACRRFLRPPVVMLILIPVLSPCCLPPGCGPGDVPSNPISSNLVDYTVPASQSILRLSHFHELDVYFLKPVVRASFGLGAFGMTDDLVMCRIEAGASTCDPGDPSQAVDEHDIFPFFGWGCSTSPECDPQSPAYDSTVSDLLKLTVSTSALTPGKYLLRILKDADTPLTSVDGHHLADDVDIFITVVADDAPSDMPEIDSTNLDDTDHGYFTPHKRIKIEFSKPMAFVNLVTNILGGFNFRNIEAENEGIIGIESDSTQGLTPGQGMAQFQGLPPRPQYQLDIVSKDSTPNKLPWTMDLFGNTLANTASWSFETSHVRILVPLHHPFSDQPEDWVAQLESMGYNDELFVMVDVAADVDKLTAVGPDGRQSDISFTDRAVTEEEKTGTNGEIKKLTSIRIDIDPSELTVCEPSSDPWQVGNYTMNIFTHQALEIFAWSQSDDDGWSYLGSDSLVVNPFQEGVDPGFPEAYYFIRDYPDDDEGGYKNELNGVAHDESHWYFSKNEPAKLYKVPISISLGEDFYNEDRSRGLYTIGIADTPLQAEGYDHFGDIDMRDDGYLCAPLEGGRVPAIAIFYSSPGVGDFHYVGKFYLNDQQRAGWCAFNPVNGYLYSSGWPSVDNPIYKYDIEINFDPDVCVEDVPDTCVGDVSAEQVGRLYLQSGQSIWNRLPVYGSDGAWELRQMQGGAFSPRGHLYLVNGYRDGFNRHKGGIWVFEIEETGPGLELGTLVNHSNQEDEPGTFKFEFHPGDYDSSRDEEPEGVDIWDLDQYPAFSLTPLSGQIHVIMIDNYPFGDPEGDDLFFKHYTVLHEDKCKI